jgi:hypothetical protein
MKDFYKFIYYKLLNYRQAFYHQTNEFDTVI